MLGQVTYIAACVAAFVLVLRFADGIWLAIGLTAVAFFAGGIFEVLIDFRYGNYRKEWELANGPDLSNEGSNNEELGHESLG
jgi:uncharacterized membrane protein YjjP (DUF1212 family)